MAYSDVFVEDWNSNTLASYTFDEGSSAGMSISGGFLSASGTATGSGVRADLTAQPTQRATVKFQWATTNAISFGGVLKRISANNFLMGQVTSGASAPSIQLYTRVAGTFSNKTNVAISAKSPNTDYWWRVSISGNVVSGEFFTSDPFTGGAVVHTTTFTLTGTDATSFGTGVSGAGGFRFSGVIGDGKIDFIRVEQDAAVGASLVTGPSPTFKALIGR